MGYVEVLIVGELTLLYSFICFLDIRCLKWRATIEQSIHDNSKRPDINLIAMTAVVDNLWSKVVGSATYSFSFLSWVLDSGCKTEITYFDFHVLIKHDIS